MGEEALLCSESHLVNEIPELRSRFLVEHYVACTEGAVGNLSFRVQALQHLVEADLVAVVELLIVGHHRLGEVLHRGILVDGETSEVDAGHRLVASTLHRDRG